MKLKELLIVMHPNVKAIVLCNETNMMGTKEELFSHIDSRDLLTEVTGVYTNEYGNVIIAVDLTRFHE